MHHHGLPSRSRVVLLLATLLLSACGAVAVANPTSHAKLSPAAATPSPVFTSRPSPRELPTLTARAASPSLAPALTPRATSVSDPVRAFVPLRGPTIGGCPVFPDDNAWNEDVSRLPVDPLSSAYISRIDSFRQLLHPDFGSDPAYGIPYTVVPGTQPMVPITFTAYGDESDPGPYPIPLTAPVEAGSDRHVLVLDQGDCRLYEMFDARQSGAGWSCDAGAVFNLNSDLLRPDTWTSADAAGLPILPGLVRYDEVAAGVINHALRFTVDETQNGFIHPATHQAGVNNPDDPPMGLRLRLKSSFDLSHFRGESLVILTALKKYGMMVADNGSSWFISGATDPRWDDADLDQLKTVPGSAFEVVETGPIRRG